MSENLQELALAIRVLREAHYRFCDTHHWPDMCPIFKAWDERRPKPAPLVGDER